MWVVLFDIPYYTCLFGKVNIFLNIFIYYPIFMHNLCIIGGGRKAGCMGWKMKKSPPSGRDYHEKYLTWLGFKSGIIVIIWEG